MLRRLMTRLFLIAAVAATVSPARAETERAKSVRPNIVFILIDDLRFDTFGYMGHPFVETPHIDRLAREGVQFRRAFVTTSLCSPARASFLTGQYMHNHRVVDNADLMPEGTVTFPQLLQKSGYETAFVGKWHMGGSSDAPRPGFDHWVSFRGQGTYAPEGHSLNINGEQVPRTKYMTDELTDYSVDWLKERNGDEPFLLYLSHKGVHGLYDPAPRHRDRYRNEPFPAPGTMDETLQPPPAGDAGKPMWVHDQRNSWHGIEFPYHGRAKQSIAEMYRHYCEMILSIDDSVGHVLEALEKRGLEDNTLVLFTSDGGHLWGEHGLIDKRCAYEESIRIPLLAWGPSTVAAGKTCDAVVANIDVAPTLLELADLDVPSQIDGRSFASLLQNPETAADRDSLLYEYYWEPAFPQTPTTFALRGPRYKLIQYHGVWDTDELYDLQDDPHETTNLIGRPEHQQRVNQMRRQLHDRLKETGGLAIPLGVKRNHGATLRRADGTKRAEFPERLEQQP
ncbi:Arylsulfatase [Maioricimonas rarisocia]|uniref:Arylsulfatase n=1 Tax=Maioricimonas rarisocia TaxID=2528026 RepID=A0A517Z826_9PLAN|nr:sulfatase [Maioricimonas rarisocia]QDU38613.1 Arylsulfatase [Maioricimonas rarisocia]